MLCNGNWEYKNTYEPNWKLLKHFINVQYVGSHVQLSTA